MSKYEATGRTLDEAIETALGSLGIRKDNAEVEILSEPNQGLLGIIGNKSARVMVKIKMEPAQYLQAYLQELLQYMDVEGSVVVGEDNEKLEAEVSGSDVGSLIGRRGKTLSDLQYLLNVIMRRQFANLNKMIFLDVEKYRSRREKTLTQLAKNVARKVIQEGREQALEPMTPQERRIIHLALHDLPEITTYSDGEEPYRKVIVAPS